MSGCGPRRSDADETGTPGFSSCTCSCGSTWQSVDFQITSSPLVIVNTCTSDPASIVHGAVAVLLSTSESCGFTPGSYATASVTASTVTFAGSHSATSSGSVETVAFGRGVRGIRCPPGGARAWAHDDEHDDHDDGDEAEADEEPAAPVHGRCLGPTGLRNVDMRPE